MTRTRGWRDPAKRSMEPSRVADILSGLLRQPVFAPGMKLGTLARRWPDVVGERLAAETVPARLEGGTLVVAAATGPWGAQAMFLAEEIRKSANRALSTDEIKRVKIVVDEALLGGRKTL